jgi:hypothetical protein
MPVINKKELGKRLAQLPQVLGTNNRRIALSIGADPSYYGRALKGNGISMNLVEKLIDEYKITRNWILFGEGEPISKEENNQPLNIRSKLNDSVQATSSPDVIDFINQLPISDKEKIALYKERISALEKENQYWRKCAELLKKLSNPSENNKI